MLACSSGASRQFETYLVGNKIYLVDNKIILGGQQDIPSGQQDILGGKHFTWYNISGRQNILGQHRNVLL